MDLKPTIEVRIYDWHFCILENGTVMSKNDALNKPWDRRNGREVGMTDSHLGAIRNLISNVRGIFPEKQPTPPAAEPLKEVVRPSATQVV